VTPPGGVDRWIPVVTVALAGLPIGVLVGWLLIRWRRPRPARDSVAEVAIVVGTLPWIWMILTPLDTPRETKLVPLLDIMNQLTVSLVAAFFQIVGNLLVFAAFGFFAPIRWRIGIPAVMLMAGLGSVTVETLQYVLDIGRVTSIDDVLLNASGAGLAALSSSRWRSSRWRSSRWRSSRWRSLRW